MPIHNHDIADIFERMADLLEIEGANPFRVRAYRNAARVVDSMSQNLADLCARGMDLKELPGVGQDLAGKIQEIIQTGDLGALKELEARTPPTLAALMQFGSLGGLVPIWIVIAIGQTLEGMLVTPLLVGKRIGLHPVAVIFALLAFGQIFGFFGVLLALPASAALLVGLRHLGSQYRNSSLYGK